MTTDHGRVAPAAAWCRLVCVMVFSVVAVPADAEERWHIGALLGASAAFVDDPDGETQTGVAVDVLNVMTTVDAGRDQRWVGHLFSHTAQLDAGVDAIGQDITTSGATMAWQYRWRISRAWKPWIGGGLGLSHDRFRARHLVDRDGFLVRRYPDRTEETVSVVLNTSTELARVGAWEVGIHLQYGVPVTGSLSRLSIGVMVLY
ncbi:MAG: hypothetical protein ACOYXR_10075 [Nitrospirota bacterium]